MINKTLNLYHLYNYHICIRIIYKIGFMEMRFGHILPKIHLVQLVDKENKMN